MNAPLGGASARFDGYFKVEKGKAGVTLTVADEAGNDYTENLTLTVQDGRLTFTNSKPKGMYLIVR